jgi:ribosomal 50S subunit-associated protein YjgA (DUF615 family)
MALSRLPQHRPERPLLHRVDIDLVAQIAGVADALHQRLGQADDHAAGVEEAEGVGPHIAARHILQKIARLRSRDLEAGDAVRDVLDRAHAVLHVAVEPAHVEVLCTVAGGQAEFGYRRGR